ncbi:MAG: hypothetical protein ISP01_01420 [Methanobrevibacter arboriphilus]|uniref:Uncharacterized protein n=1 Tax=Methanobrevibacter arboriphilus TaxID=39441 RepID=A0A843AAY4_METAZ|nr:hypothetical protein [Methanobrevibacter arboriphilus]MBF4468042.1 hypothetical protein [Methanobrevibacter arboriphilus]
MDGLYLYSRLLAFALVYGIFTIFYWVYREPFGKLIDKIFPFPYLRKGGNYKYINGDEELSPEGFIVTIFFLFAILGLVFLSVFEFNLLVFPIVFLLFFPACLLLLRIRMFSDDNISSSTGIGYSFHLSYFLSLLGSVGFLMVFAGFLYNETPFWFNIIAFILALSSAIFPMIPDHINRLLSYDIRSEKGYKFLKNITLLLVISFWVFVFVFFISTGVSPSELMPVRFGGR